MTRIRSRLVPVKRGASQTPSPTFWAPFTDSGSGVLNTTLSRGTGSITWTRAGATATTILSTGLVSSTIAANTGRSYYDPTTLQYLGGLLEEARTNLCLQSQALDDAAWTKANSTITANAISSPDGTTTADKIVENTATAAHLAVSSFGTITANATCTVSAFVKSGERARIRIDLADAGVNGCQALFNLGTVSVTSSGALGTGTYTSSSITAFPNGWFRLVVTGKVDAAAVSAGIRILLADGAGSISYTGDGSSGAYAWGAQLEAGAFATSYIPTTAATVTRAADVATCPISGNIDQTVGSAFCRFMVAQQNPSVGQSCISNDSGAGIGYIYVPAAASTLISTYDGTTVTSSGVVSDFRGIPTRAAASWGGATKSIYVNGSNKGSGAFDGSYNGTVLYIGNSGASNVLNGCIRDIRIWQRVLSDSQIASIR